MLARCVVAAAGLCGCAAPLSEDSGVFTSGGAASSTSFECSRSAVASLGYAVIGYDGDGQSLRAERRAAGNTAEGWRGYLTVTVSPDTAGRFLRVRGERFTEASRLPLSANPRPQPAPTPTPVPMPRGRAQTSKRVSPGPVAADARQVVRRCSLSGGGHLAAGWP